MNSHEFLSEPIWLNKRYLHKGKPIFISNWIKSGIFYVKDLYNENGQFIPEQNIIQKLSNKQNWISEYSLVKKIISRKRHDFDKKLARFINIKPNWTILVNNLLHSLKTMESRTGHTNFFFFSIANA